jgi:hypothetical protein
MSMAVLLEGLNIPEGNPITINIYRDGTWVNAYTTEDGNAIEVHEPHGRLISADELIEFIENRYEITWKDDYEGGIKDACVDILEKISTMPTVIPASEEGE